jgi:hypothetical protein
MQIKTKIYKKKLNKSCKIKKLHLLVESSSANFCKEIFFLFLKLINFAPNVMLFFCKCKKINLSLQKINLSCLLMFFKALSLQYNFKY